MLRECRRPIYVQQPISFSYPLPLVFKNMDTYNQPIVTIVQMIMSKQCYLPNIALFSLDNIVIVLTSQNPPSLSLKDADRPGYPMPMLTISAHLSGTYLDFCFYIFCSISIPTAKILVLQLECDQISFHIQKICKQKPIYYLSLIWI